MGKTRVLVFSTISPLPINRGDRSRLFHVLCHLREMAEVRLVYLSRDWEPVVADLSPLEGITVRTLSVSKAEVFRQAAGSLLRGRPPMIFRFDTPRIADFVRRQVAEFQPDVFWGSPTEASAFYRCAGTCKRVLDMVDSLTLYYDTVGAQPGMPLRARLMGLSQPRLAHFERAALRDSDCTLVSSPPNRDHLQHAHGHSENIKVLYAAVSDQLLQRRWQPVPSVRMLFVGYLGYLPNALAVQYAAEHILPRVRARVPQAEMIVCGGGGTGLARTLAGTPGFTFTGFVEDLIALYLSASLLLIPVPYATGVQTKLVEAMALGLPTVVSEASRAANGLTDGEHTLVAENAEGYVAAVEAILNDQALALRLGAGGRRLIEARHTEQSQKRQIAEILEHTLGDPATPGGRPVREDRATL